MADHARAKKGRAAIHDHLAIECDLRETLGRIYLSRRP